jgi:ATP-dependent protease ClpP protease subunit
MNGTSLIFNGEIVLEGDVLPHEWCMWTDDSCFSARMVREALSQFPGDVTVRVNSSGGDPFEGEAIRAALDAHAGKVTVIVAGVAASAASLLIMSADVIVMTAGSHLMIHEPRAAVFGVADEMRGGAEYLDTLTATYAQVYATRSGQTVEAVRELMRADHWMGPQAAIDTGFADEIQDIAKPQGVAASADAVDPALAAAMAAHEASRAVLRMCANKSNSLPDIPAVTQAATGGQSTVMMATTEEPGTMENEDLTTAPATGAAAPAAASAAPAATTDTQMRAAQDAGAQAERARQRGIRDLAAPYMQDGSLTAAQVEAVIDDGTAVEHAGNRFLTAMSAQRPIAPIANGTPARARSGGGDSDPQMEAMISALMGDYSGAGAQYRHLGVRSLAMSLSGHGMHGHSAAESIREGMRATTMMGGAHGVSDFSYITREVMNRTLAREYERRAPNWRVVTGEPMRASDFREMHSVRFGGDFQMKKVKENGEYEEAVLSDNADGLKVERYGRRIGITFEAVVNDDMGALTRIPREFAIAARVMEAKIVWALFKSNPVLASTGNALFSTAHKNLAGSSGAITVGTVGAGRKAMWEQTSYGSKADAEDFLSVSPTHLIVPPALETQAAQFVADTAPSKSEDVNPWRSLVPVAVPNLGAFAGGSDAAWYLVSEDMPPISVATLDGFEAPTVTTLEGMNPDKMEMQARHIFGAAATEQRGAYKNP